MLFNQPLSTGELLAIIAACGAIMLIPALAWVLDQIDDRDRHCSLD